MNKQYKDYVKAQEAKRKAKKTISLLKTTLRGFPTPSKLNKEWFLKRASTESTKTGKLLSPATLRFELGLARRVLKFLDMPIDVLPEARDLPKIKPSVTIEDIYTLEEYNALIAALTTTRNKAMIQVLYESGMRAGELLSMTFKNLSFIEEDYAEVIVNGKTGSRRVPLIDSLPSLRQWLNTHPTGDGPIWIHEHGEVKALEYGSLYQIVSRGLKRAGITGKKRIVHMLRHTRATHLRKEVTDSKARKKLLGWKQNSNMDAIYEHLDDSDAIDAYRQSRGQVPKENGSFQRLISPVVCPKCEATNPPDGKLCSECNTPLQGTLLKEALSRSEESSKMAERLEYLEDKLERLAKFQDDIGQKMLVNVGTDEEPEYIDVYRAKKKKG